MVVVVGAEGGLDMIESAHSGLGLLWAACSEHARERPFLIFLTNCTSHTRARTHFSATAPSPSLASGQGLASRAAGSSASHKLMAAAAAESSRSGKYLGRERAYANAHRAHARLIARRR